MIHIVSYPRSGNTWIRFLLSNLLYPDEDINWRNINRFVPDLHQRRHWEKDKVQNPQFVKSHFVFLSEYEKVIYVYRDGRDVALSLYHYLRMDEAKEDRDGMSFGQYFSQIFIPAKLQFGGWKVHVNLWTSGEFKVNCIFVQYENMITDPLHEVTRMVKFLELEKTQREIVIAIGKSAYKEVMKIAPRDGQHPKNAGLRGTSGGWKKIFTESQNEMFWDYAGDLMEKLGYKKEE